MYNTAEHLPIGYKIGNHYKIEKVLGQGGFGIVYLVRDEHQLDKVLVIKELFSKEFSFRNQENRHVSNKIKAKNLFVKIKEGIIREVNILSKIRNKNVVKAYGYLQENNTLYSIMEYIEGDDLGKIIDKEGIFSESEAKKLLQQLIDGLKEIHKQDIIHRDVKPNNIMKTPQGVYKLIDFSTNKKYSDNSMSAITGFTNHIFTSPELQETRAVIGKYSDIYSMGMTILRVLSTEERLPNLTDRLTDPSNDSNFYHYIDVLNISNDFKQIIKKMTELKKENRYQNLKELEDAFIKKEDNIEGIKTEIVDFLQTPEKRAKSSLIQKEKPPKAFKKREKPKEEIAVPKKEEFDINSFIEKSIKALIGIVAILSVVALGLYVIK